jgi:predicted DNA-binding protein with PD1-like motif
MGAWPALFPVEPRALPRRTIRLKPLSYLRPVRYLLILLLFVSCQSRMNKTHALRLKPGQDLKKELTAFVAREGIEAGWIVTCAGSLTEYTLRFANQPEGTKGNGHFEILSLTGTLSVAGSHLHLGLADSTGRAFGGHLMDGNIIYTTAEIIIEESDALEFRREKDGTTPWEELQIRRKK